jgi:hypothetical protein
MQTKNSTIAPMKRRLFLSILFIVATLVSSLHELKHIENHDSSSCQICIVDNHSVASDIIVTLDAPLFFSFEAITLTSQTRATFTKKTANHSNAPPLFS